MGGDTEQGHVKQRSARNAIELKALMKMVNGIRRDGYMFSKHIIVQDAGVIAVLLPKRDFGRNLILGVGGPVSRLEERQDEILACIGEGIVRVLPRPDTSERKELGPSSQMKTSRP